MHREEYQSPKCDQFVKDSQYPNMDLQRIGQLKKSKSQRISPQGSLLVNPVVEEQEDNQNENKEEKEIEQKNKHKYFQIDTDEFNNQKSEQILFKNQSTRVKSISIEMNSEAITEAKVEEDQQNQAKMHLSQHKIEEAYVVDRCEFVDCNTPTKLKQINKKLNSSMYASYSQKDEEPIKEDEADKEFEPELSTSTQFEKQKQIKCDEINDENMRSYKVDQEPIQEVIVEDLKEEDVADDPKCIQSKDKQERENEKQYLKNIVKNDIIHEEQNLYQFIDIGQNIENMKQFQQDEKIDENEENDNEEEKDD